MSRLGAPSARLAPLALLALLLGRASSLPPVSPCGFPPPSSAPGGLWNNTRLDFSAPSPTPFACASPALCLARCQNDSACGGVTFVEPYQPLPVDGCEGKAPSDGCCHFAPLLD